jgi:YfiH family protein
MSEPYLRSALLGAEGIFHGFGTRALESEADLFAALRTSCARQVHGVRVLWVEADTRPWEEEADALATREARLVAVRTADCVPVLLADVREGRVAAVHAGWRGTLARIVERAVESLVRAGSRPKDLVAAIGPAIGRCCYEVSPDLAARFESAFGPRVRADRRLDLPLANRISLESCGLSPDRVETIDVCTFCDGRFHSFRREGESAGRQHSFVHGRPVS